MKKIILTITVFSCILITNAQDSNIKIGLSSPAYGVKINANFPTGTGGWARGFHIANQSSNTFISLGVYGGYENGLSSFNYGYIGKAYNDTHMVFSPNGNIGIGTVTPTDKLTVVGNVNIGGALGSRLKLRHIDGKDYDSTDYDHLYVNYGTGKDLFVGKATNPSDLFVTGNVGIATTVIPSGYKFAVAGKMITEEVKVQLQTSWPDFVFEKHYKLPTLKEVENHIKEKGHLQNIPSAEEVKKEGFFLGEMNAKLLQKIEELTLYTIQQEKKLKEQSEDINQLKALVEKLINAKK